MSEEMPKLDENFYIVRANRITLQYCRDKIARRTYKPFSSKKNCTDCILFEVEGESRKHPELKPWCRRKYPQGVPELLTPEDFAEKPKTCGSYQLLNITVNYCGLVPKVSGGVREVSPIEFCRAYPNPIT